MTEIARAYSASRLAPGGSEEHAPRAEVIVALVAVAATAVRIPMPLDVPFNFVVALVVLPVAVRYLSRYQWATGFAILTVLATMAGLLLAYGSMGEVSNSLLVAQAARVASFGIVLPLFLWARSSAGTRRTVFAYALGLLVNLALSGQNDANLWKFTFAAPVILLVLSLPVTYGRRLPQAIAGTALAVVSLVFDSRSLAGFLLIAVALTLTQRSDTSRRPGMPRRGTWMTIVRLGIVVTGAYLLLQAAILEGMLGDGIRERTEAQIQSSGSVIVGGRPEIGASIALLADRPGGFGLGVLATPTDVVIAKSGMSALGYDPNNGYVERYMFGQGFEVHSVLGDLWILCGPLGALVGLVAAAWLIRGMAYRVASGTATAVVIYIASRSLWDIGFSPIYTSASLLPLALAVVALPRARARYLAARPPRQRQPGPH